MTISHRSKNAYRFIIQDELTKCYKDKILKSFLIIQQKIPFIT